MKTIGSAKKPPLKRKFGRFFDFADEKKYSFSLITGGYRGVYPPALRDWDGRHRAGGQKKRYLWVGLFFWFSRVEGGEYKRGGIEKFSTGLKKKGHTHTLHVCVPFFSG